MRSRNFVVVALLVGGTLLAVSGADPAKKEKKKGKKEAAAPFVHSVIFYLKSDAPQGTADTIIDDCHKMLGKIPAVRGLKAGKPAEKSKPDIAKTDFQVGLLVLLDNEDGLHEYLEHPSHKEFVAKHGSHINREKLLVFDFVNQEK